MGHFLLGWDRVMLVESALLLEESDSTNRNGRLRFPVLAGLMIVSSGMLGEESSVTGRCQFFSLLQYAAGLFGATFCLYYTPSTKLGPGFSVSLWCCRTHPFRGFALSS
jgi:hypothetical protein